ncbi:Mss4-like protein [Aspergillus karnatakaensis]|uniref:GFA family protein n=1 Tax=Aspergillus karnatakaensis TaxID=1810916 RepID=UPI003CCD4D98
MASPPNTNPNADKAKPYFPLAGASQDGWSTSDRATATCFCGAVQLSFPTNPPGLVTTFICNCTDCRKITASMFASNFTVDDKYLIHERGRELLSSYSQSKTIATGNTMMNFFCSVCGSLMYRVGTGFSGMSILRIGTVDDFTLHETKLKPRVEQFVKDRVCWLSGAEGVEQVEGSADLHHVPIDRLFRVLATTTAPRLSLSVALGFLFHTPLVAIASGALTQVHPPEFAASNAIDLVFKDSGPLTRTTTRTTTAAATAAATATTVPTAAVATTTATAPGVRHDRCIYRNAEMGEASWLLPVLASPRTTSPDRGHDEYDVNGEAAVRPQTIQCNTNWVKLPVNGEHSTTSLRAT